MALTEYLILLALLVAGVVGSARMFGVALGGTWADWAGFYARLMPTGGESSQTADLDPQSDPATGTEPTGGPVAGAPSVTPVKAGCSSARGLTSSRGQSAVSCR